MAEIQASYHMEARIAYRAYAKAHEHCSFQTLKLSPKLFNISLDL